MLSLFCQAMAQTSEKEKYQTHTPSCNIDISALMSTVMLVIFPVIYTMTKMSVLTLFLFFHQLCFALNFWFCSFPCSKILVHFKVCMTLISCMSLLLCSLFILLKKKKIVLKNKDCWILAFLCLETKREQSRVEWSLTPGHMREDNENS